MNYFYDDLSAWLLFMHLLRRSDTSNTGSFPQYNYCVLSGWCDSGQPIFSTSPAFESQGFVRSYARALTCRSQPKWKSLASMPLASHDNRWEGLSSVRTCVESWTNHGSLRRSSMFESSLFLCQSSHKFWINSLVLSRMRHRSSL